MSDNSGGSGVKKSKLFLRPIVGALIIAAFVFAGLLLFWILDKYFAYRWAQWYVGKIALVFDVNEHFAEAITIVVAVLLALLSGLIFSFDRRKRSIGLAGVIGLLVVNSLVLWAGTRSQYVSRSGVSLKCYFFNGDKVEYGERPGFDPQTGRQCRPVSPEIRVRLQAYETGQRPKLVEKSDIVFFDARNGEPIIWYARSREGRVRLFDLMGFDPEIGTELTPITADIVAEWRTQMVNDQQRVDRLRAPKRIESANIEFFHPVTGNPQVWYWRDDAGNFEFFDRQGFHPFWGKELLPVTREVVEQWKQKRSEADDKEQKAAEKANAIRIRQEQEAQRQQQIAEAEAARRTEAASECDRLAANPYDQNKSKAVSGVSYGVLGAQAALAISACETAVKFNPNEPRLKYQLARAYQQSNAKQATRLLEELVATNYPAAFDNLGSLYLDGRAGTVNKSRARELFRRGAELGDPDSMLSYARILSAGTPSASPEVYALYKRAAEIGHRDAIVELARLDDLRRQEEIKQKLLEKVIDGVGGLFDHLTKGQ